MADELSTAAIPVVLRLIVPEVTPAQTGFAAPSPTWRHSASPNPDFGEEVKAVVQPVRWFDAHARVGRRAAGLLPSPRRRHNCTASIELRSDCLARKRAGFTSGPRDHYLRGRELDDTVPAMR